MNKIHYLVKDTKTGISHVISLSPSETILEYISKNPHMYVVKKLDLNSDFVIFD